MWEVGDCPLADHISHAVWLDRSFADGLSQHVFVRMALDAVLEGRIWGLVGFGGSAEGCRRISSETRACWNLLLRQRCFLRRDSGRPNEAVCARVAGGRADVDRALFLPQVAGFDPGLFSRRGVA